MEDSTICYCAEYSARGRSGFFETGLDSDVYLCLDTGGLASLLWMYITRQFPFSTAYPMVSLSYVFGMLAAIVVFHEEVSVIKWLGVFFIILGCLLINVEH